MQRGIVDREIVPISEETLRKEFPAIRPEIILRWAQNAEFVVIERITYLSGGLKVKGFIVTPKHAGKFPGIIYNRGGSFDFGKITLQQICAIMVPMAKDGYIVVASQYRGNDGGEGHDEVGGEDVNDITSLIACLPGIKKVDSDKIGMYGWSRGGMMTLLVLRELKNIKAAVIGGAPVDQEREVKCRPEMLEVYKQATGKAGEDLLDELKKRSPILEVEKISPSTPILVLHGQSDWRVQPENSLQLVDKLIKLGRVVRLKIYEGADHGVHEFWNDVHKETMNWFDRFLKKGEPLPNTKPHGE